MEIKKFEVQYKEYIKGESIPQDIEEIIKSAVEATDTAYAPYSLYRVGSAVRMSNGEIIKGSNQENNLPKSKVKMNDTALHLRRLSQSDCNKFICSIINLNAFFN